MPIRFPYSRQDVTDDDIRAVTESLNSAFLTQGGNLAAFEATLAKKLGVKHAVACNSGTAALHLAYLALNLGPDRGLLTSPLTFLATATAARMCNAPVIFADADAATGNLTPEAAKAALDQTTVPIAAITAIHLGGRACDLAALRCLTEARGLALVEDACHAPLATYRDGDRLCSVGACEHSDVAVFSFHAIKHVAMGEGGALVTNDNVIADRARLYRNHGMTRNPKDWDVAPEPDAPWYYEMHEIGWNYRATEMQCALGLSQLARIDESIRRRRLIAKRYDELLGGLNHLATPAPDDGHVWHLYPVVIDFAAVGKSRGRVMRELADRGVGTQVHYIPVNNQPYYRRPGQWMTPGAEAYYSRTLSIPMYPGLSDGDLTTIVGHIRAVLSN